MLFAVSSELDKLPSNFFEWTFMNMALVYGNNRFIPHFYI